MQACSYLLLEGMAPEMAKEQMVCICIFMLSLIAHYSIQKVAVESGLINALGYPDTTAFGSFAYSAPPHTDKDDAVTAGWISSRSRKVALPVYLILRILLINNTDQGRRVEFLLV